MSPKIFLEKKPRKGQQKERRGKKVGEEKKSNGCTPSFYVDFFRDFFFKEKDYLRRGSECSKSALKRIYFKS